MGEAIRNDLAAELSRRELLERSASLGLGAIVLGALPALEGLANPAPALAQAGLSDATLQAFFDTIIPGRIVELTELGNPIHPEAIAGVDPEPGAVEADALLLAHDSRIGFDLLVPGFLAELELFALAAGGPFLGLGYEAREATCVQGLSFANPTRVIWEAAAAIPFTAFCAGGNIPEATRRTSVGYRVMGHPGTAPDGYRNYSYRRRLARGRTSDGNLQ